MMSLLEALFWIGLASLAAHGWQLITCLLCAASCKRPWQAKATAKQRSDLCLEIQKLMDERDKLQGEISLLQLRVCDGSSDSSNSTFPHAQVHVTISGSCYHTSANCRYVQDRSTKELKLCQLCSRKASKSK